MELKFDRIYKSAVFRRKYIKIEIKFKKPYLLCVCCVLIAFPSFRRPFWAIFCLTNTQQVRFFKLYFDFNVFSAENRRLYFDRISAPYKLSYYALVTCDSTKINLSSADVNSLSACFGNRNSSERLG